MKPADICLAVMVAVIWGLAFVASRLMPGDPIGAMLSDRAGDAVLEQRLRAQYGLDAPMLEQFLIYIRGVARGEFGFSYRFVGVPVVEVLSDSLRISPLLALSALLVFGLTVGQAVADARTTRSGDPERPFRLVSPRAETGPHRATDAGDAARASKPRMVDRPG